jgi:long-subunit fatty acid transport protein
MTVNQMKELSMRFLRWIFPIGIFILLLIPVRAAIDLTGIGTRAQSMGGNFRSIADDYSAMFWNPAGLAFQDGVRLGFSTTVVDQSSTFRVAESPLYMNDISGHSSPAAESIRQFSAVYPYTIKSSTPVVAVPSIGISRSLTRWSYGLGIWAAFGVRARYDLIGTSDYGRGPLFSGVDWDDDMKFIDIHPTVAYRFSDRFSAGLGLSVIIADIYLRKPAFSPMNPYLTADAVQSLFLQYAGLLPSSMQDELTAALEELRSSPRDHLIADTRLKGRGLGTGGNLGILYKPAEHFQIGASVQYYANIPVKGEATVYVYYPYQKSIQTLLADSVNVGGQTYQGLLGYYNQAYKDDKINFTEYYLLSKMGQGTVDTSRNHADIRADMALPVRAGIGMSYSGFSHLILAADLSVTTWSAWDVFQILDEDGRQFNKIEKDWKNVIRVGCGIEYDFQPWKLRFGFYTESRAAIDATMVPANPDINRRNVFSLGFEIPWRKYRFFGCYEHTIMKDLTIETWVPFENGFDYKNLAGHYTSSMRNLMVGFDVAF